jgi:hypothetical protein
MLIAFCAAAFVEIARFLAVLLALGRLSPWLQRRLTDPEPVDRDTLMRVYGMSPPRSDS